jgi:uncharacterized repeat protein (TIGR03803 family)
MRPFASSCLRAFLAILAALTLASATAFAAATETILYNFSPALHGLQPSGGLISDAAGNLYGATAWGGAYGLGVVFKLTLNSRGIWIETVLYNFEGGSSAIYSPRGSLTLDAAGNLYGAAIAGGHGFGGVFRLAPNSTGPWTETVLHSFTTESDTPNGGLVFDQAGNLYGTTTETGKTVFKLSPGSNGRWTESVIYQFASPVILNGNLIVDKAGNLYGTGSVGVFELTPSSSGSWTETLLYAFSASPSGGLVFDPVGNLYGVTEGGGSSGLGVVFKLTPGSNGSWTETVLYNFQGGSDGEFPEGILAFDQNGNLYGTTYSGGTADFGTVYELVSSITGWTKTTLWNYTGGSDGGNPAFGVTLGASGQVYAASLVGSPNPPLNANSSVIELIPANGLWGETTLTRFSPTDGAGPETNLTAGTAGNFYGTTIGGGAYGYGTIFELTKSSGGIWTETVLYSFKSGLGNRGASPSALILDAEGNLYGETAYGGAPGFGTVFELSPSAPGKWTEKDLYTFTGGTAGDHPLGGLVFDAQGNLYGATEYGGSGSGCGVAKCGIVFKLAPSSGTWSQTVIYNFTGGATDGANPGAGLVFDQNGNLYGTTQFGGNASACTKGCGVVFQLSPSAGVWTEHLLYMFTNAHPDGRQPAANLIFDPQGNLYGTTEGGGTAHATCCGIVFKLSPNSGGPWSETVLLSFPSDKSEGAYPAGALVLDGSGNLYGTTSAGGQYASGTVYELSLSGGIWTETILHSFGPTGLGEQDGAEPSSGLLLDSSGNLYGTTPAGGQAIGGTVFEITP